MRSLRCAAILLFAIAIAADPAGMPERHVVFHYAFTVRNTHLGAPLRIWIPLAHSDQFQTVRVISQNGDLPLRGTREAEYGNQMLYAEAAKADKGAYSFEIVYNVTRKESSRYGSGALSATQERRWLAPDRLVPITGVPAKLAGQQVATVKGGDYDRAHALYEYVLANMHYDHDGTGWGHGDALYACAAKHGNCTDFHSLFIAMARSQEIPARFEIGFPLPRDKHSGEIAGYHCWAEFYAQGLGWIPIDASDGWNQPARREYFFGHQDENRVQMTIGRDITLSPRQNGEPLNYFVYPYVEVDGKPYANVSNRFSFESPGVNTKVTNRKSVSGKAFQ